MKIIEQSVELINAPKYEDLLRVIEMAGRVCYKSEGKIEDGSAERFVHDADGRWSGRLADGFERRYDKRYGLRRRYLGGGFVQLARRLCIAGRKGARLSG